MRDVSKTYRIYSQPSDRLKHAFAPWTRPYQDHEALAGVTFDVRRGEALGVIGRNGAGKSTLLQIAAGVLRPTRGRVERRGRVVALLELGTGFNPDFTGAENVRLAAALHGLSAKETEDRFDAIMDFAELGAFADAPVRTYSSGMRARLGFAVMMHVDGDVLIVDEALAVGDAAFRQKCMRTMRAFAKEKALLFVSHSASAVLGLCERAIWIDGGRVRANGPAKEVVRAYEAELETSQSKAMRFRAPARTATAARNADQSAPNAAANIMARKDAAERGLDVFDFDPEAAALTNDRVDVVSVTLRPSGDDRGNAHVMTGGADVTLTVEARAQADLDNVIIGFYVRNDQALPLFGDNTYAATKGQHRFVPAGETVTASFRFDLPCLAAGDYAVSVAVATGTPDEHAYQVRMDEALMFRVHQRYFEKGLIGVPIRAITLRAGAGDLDDAA